MTFPLTHYTSSVVSWLDTRVTSQHGRRFLARSLVRFSFSLTIPERKQRLLVVYVTCVLQSLS